MCAEPLGGRGPESCPKTLENEGFGSLIELGTPVGTFLGEILFIY